MGLLDDAGRDATPDAGDDDPEPTPTRDPAAGAVARLSRASEVDVAGESVTIESPETTQPDSETGNWLTGGDAYGLPRGIDAIENRQIVQTSAMQSIVNGIVDQLLGGDLAFLDDEDALDALGPQGMDAVDSFKPLLRDVLTGPHMGDEDLDDLVTAAVEDMLGVGNAYWQPLSAEGDGPPVVALTTLDPLTIRHNYDEHGYPETPPYWQAAGAFAGGTVASLGTVDPVPLESDDLIVMRYPKGNRSYKRYPVSAAWQVKEWLEILANSTTHHNRYYSDNEIPPGMLQIVDATNTTVENIKNKVQEASGDPRDMPVVGGDAPANWIEMGGTAINLDIIQEQQWFYELCLGSLGLGKAEVGMIEDVNRANGKIEAERVFKRVGGPFGKQFEQAFVEIARQFDVFRELGEPFTPTLAYTDPREEAAQQERLRQEFETGTITLKEYHRRSGNEDLASDDDRFTVAIGGEEVDYGAHPWPVAKRLLAAAGATDPDAAPPPGDGEGE